jgi:LacI family transcriptional regulator
MRVAEEMGYYPDAVARSMVTLRSGIIAVVVPDVVNPVFPAMITTLHEVLQNKGMRMMLFLERNYEEGPHDVLGVSGWPVDGVVVASATTSSPVVKEILNRQIPAVLMQRDAPLADTDRVMPDDETGCAAVARHLVDLGHTRVGMIAGSPQTSSGQARRDFFEKALATHGLVLEERFIRVAEPSFRGSESAARSLLSMEESPTAVFCASDTIAITTLDVARQMSLEVPTDVSVVGFDDIDAAGWSMVDLTTVRQDVNDQCTLALSMLLDRVEGYQGSARSRVCGVELVVRGTTGRPRGIGPDERSPASALG